MNRRQLLGIGSAVTLTGVSGCLTKARPSNGTDTTHLESGVWGQDKNKPLPDTRIFEDEATALGNVVGSEAERFEEFVRATDFQKKYLVLVQNIGVGAGTKLTLRETEFDDGTLYLKIDAWPPSEDEPHPDAIFSHSIATRLSAGDHGIPNTVRATVKRPDDRTTLEEIIDRMEYIS